MKKLLVMIGAAAMLPITSSAAWSEDTYTFTTNGVEWTFHVDMEAHAALMGKLAAYSEGSAAGNTAIPTDTSGLLQVPEWVECEGVRCDVIGLAYAALMNATKLTGLFWPSTTFGTQIGRAAMPRASSQLRAVWICGPRTVDSGEQPKCYFDSGDTYWLFRNDSHLRVVLFGPNVNHHQTISNSAIFDGCNDVRFFCPKAYWSDIPDAKRGGTNCKTILYGPGEDIDVSIDGTFTVATSNRLDDVLSVANYLHDYCGMNPRINVTNVIEIADGMITAEKLAFLSSGTFNSLVFKVNTQAQLDTLLAAIPSSVPFAINPADSRMELTVPQGREVYVKLSAEGKNGKYTPKINGLIISFH